MAVASNRPVLAPSAQGLQRRCSTPSLRLSSGPRRARRAVTVNSVSLDSVEDSINETIDKTVAAYDVTKQVVTDLSEKASPAVSALVKFAEANAPLVQKGIANRVEVATANCSSVKLNRPRCLEFRK